MAYQEILYDVSSRIATVTLNRPDKLNAWTAVMEREVRAVMLEAERDPEVRVIVLTGAGRGFCAGADMSRPARSSTRSRRDGSNAAATTARSSIAVSPSTRRRSRRR